MVISGHAAAGKHAAGTDHRQPFRWAASTRHFEKETRDSEWAKEAVPVLLDLARANSLEDNSQNST
jgi:hypothetical protein